MPPTRGSRLVSGLRHPLTSTRSVLAIVRSKVYPFWWRLRGLRVSVGRNLRIDGRLVLRGPGRVTIGDNVRIGMVVTPWTYDSDAEIVIGDGTFLNGTRFGCKRRITVGEGSILADARIMDTNFHSLHVNRRDTSAPVKVEPVTIGKNVWVGAAAGLLPGTTIGDNSVVGFGAVCSGDFPSNSLIAGNPAKVVKPLPGIVEPNGQMPQRAP